MTTKQNTHARSANLAETKIYYKLKQIYPFSFKDIKENTQDGMQKTEEYVNT